MLAFVTQESDRESFILTLMEELDQKGWETGPRVPTCGYRQLSGVVAAKPSLIILEICLRGGVPDTVLKLKAGCPQAQLILLYAQVGNDELVERLRNTHGAAAVIVVPPHLLDNEETLKRHLQKQVPENPACLAGSGSGV